MRDVSQWLEGLGLGEYAGAFAENRIDVDVLPSLTSNDLKDIGVVAVGDRRKLLDAITALSAPDEEPTDEPVEDASSSSDRRAEAERRQLTVMFCDLVGSTELSARLDPEDLREVMRRYQDAVAGVVVRFEGHVAKFLGDGVLAFFGWPRAYEDQAERAVRSGLAAVEVVADLKTEDGQALQARVGIATGQVVIGDIVGEAATEAAAVAGETPNLAARLLEVASPGQVVIGATTRLLIGKALTLEDIGSHRLKGFAEPVPTWRVVGESAAESRFQAAHSGTLTQLVGRRHELGLLQERWQLAKSGEGQAVLLSGEAGIGKSRMMRALDEHIAEDRPIRLRYQCASHRSNSAFFPIIQRLERTAGFSAEDPPEIKLDKLEAVLKRGAEDLDEVAPLFAALLSVPSEARYGPLELTPQELGKRTNAALVNQVLTLGRQRPVLFALEDAHWIDPTTETLIGELMAGIGDAAVLMLITHRPDYVPPWAAHTHLTSVALNRLSRKQSAEIVGAIATERLAGAVVDDIVARADGVPLYIEELAKFVVETSASSDDPAARAQIPETLQASLVARLDRLGAAKEVAQIGSVVGRVFRHELIQAVADRPDDELNDALDQIVESGLLFGRGVPPDATYTFKHALVRDAAYQSLLRSTREQYHLRIAGALDRHFPAVAENEPEVLAHHYTEAGLVEQALPYWQDAGRRSIQRSANLEAISHLKRGLELSKVLPDTPEHARRELALQIALGVPLRATRGFAAPEVGEAYVRALELCQRVGETSELVPVLRGLWEFHELRAEYQSSREFGERLLALAQRTQDPGSLLIAHNVLGDNLFWLGEFATARSHLEQGSALYDAQDHQAHVHLYGYDVGVACLSFGAWALWFLGYPDQALRRGDEALGLAQRLEHPFSFAFALQFVAQLHHYRREAPIARERAAEVLRIASEEGFPLLSGMGTIIRGWALAKEKHGLEGLAEIQRGLVEWRATGHELERPHFLGLLAEAYDTVDQPGQGLAALAEARAEADKTEEGFWDAELYRLHGELSLRIAETSTGSAGESRIDRLNSEASFMKAIEIARLQQARSLELRAAMSLSRLWRRQGKTKEARQVLEAIYNWFTEGFDTPDLKEAKTLLDDLA